MSTDACKKTIRRFIARRGSPLVTYSDNGTNFVGNLHGEIKKIHIDLGSTFTTALGAVPIEYKLDANRLLRCVLMESKSMVNSRSSIWIRQTTNI